MTNVYGLGLHGRVRLSALIALIVGASGFSALAVSQQQPAAPNCTCRVPAGSSCTGAEITSTASCAAGELCSCVTATGAGGCISAVGAECIKRPQPAPAPAPKVPGAPGTN